MKPTEGPMVRASQNIAGIESCPAHLFFEDAMKRKPIQVDTKTHRILQREAVRQSMKPGFSVTMGGIIAQLAAKLPRKRGNK